MAAGTAIAADCVENIRYASPISVWPTFPRRGLQWVFFFLSFFFNAKHVSERPAPAAVNLHRPQKWMLTNTFHFSSWERFVGKLKREREKEVAKCPIYLFARKRKNYRDNVEFSVTRKRNCRVLGAFYAMRSLYKIIFMSEVIPRVINAYILSKWTRNDELI